MIRWLSFYVFEFCVNGILLNIFLGLVSLPIQHWFLKVTCIDKEAGIMKYQLLISNAVIFILWIYYNISNCLFLDVRAPPTRNFTISNSAVVMDFLILVSWCPCPSSCGAYSEECSCWIIGYVHPHLPRQRRIVFQGTCTNLYSH